MKNDYPFWNKIKNIFSKPSIECGEAVINSDSGVTISFKKTYENAPIIVASYAFASGYNKNNVGSIVIYNTTRKSFSIIIDDDKPITRRINWIAISDQPKTSK